MDKLETIVGTKATKSELVTNNNTAKTYGSGDIDVYATPAMVGLMEGASILILDKVVPNGFSTVGTKIDVSHLAATPIGMNVTAEAELIEVTGKKLVFKVIASDERGKIGEGIHERFVIEVEKFLHKTKNK